MVMSMVGILCQSSSPDMEDLVQGLQVQLCSLSHGHVMSMAGILRQSSSPDMEDLVQGQQVQL